MRSLFSSSLFISLIVFTTGLLTGQVATGQEATGLEATGLERPKLQNGQQKTTLSLPFRVGYAEQPASIPTAENLQRTAAPHKLPPASLPNKDGLSRPSPPTPAGAISTVLGSLAVVLGIFFLLVWFTRRALPGAATGLPKEVIEILGKTPLSGRQSMHLVRVGNKLLLLSVTPSGAETLTEITDPQEVDHLASLCQRSNPSSISQTFRNVLNQMGTEKKRNDLHKDISVENEEMHRSSNLSNSLARSDV